MKRSLAALALATSACATTTTHLAAREPFEVVHSQKPRDAVAECLLNRVTSDELLPKRAVEGGTTTVSFNSHGMVMQPAIYQFVIRDEGSGSLIEVRRFAHSPLVAAETCF